MIETGAETFALPLETVEEIQVLEPTDIKLIRSREVMILRGEVVPLVRLSHFLAAGKILNRLKSCQWWSYGVIAAEPV